MKKTCLEYTQTHAYRERERERENYIYIYQCHSQREGHQSQQRELGEEYKGLSMLEQSNL